jgi:hypothetical protein
LELLQFAGIWFLAGRVTAAAKADVEKRIIAAVNRCATPKQTNGDFSPGLLESDPTLRTKSSFVAHLLVLKLRCKHTLYVEAEESLGI